MIMSCITASTVTEYTEVHNNYCLYQKKFTGRLKYNNKIDF